MKWIPSGAFYEVRGGPLAQPFMMPDNFDAARRALTERFPGSACRHRPIARRDGTHRGRNGHAVARQRRLHDPRENVAALLKLVPALGDWRLSLSQKLDQVFGDNEAVKCALAANLSYFHDDPATLWWIFFAMAQGSYLQSGGRYVQGGSQRLSSALGPRHRVAGGEVLVRRIVSGIALDAQGRVSTVTHTAKRRQRSARPSKACASSAMPRPRHWRR